MCQISTEAYLNTNKYSLLTERVVAIAWLQSVQGAAISANWIRKCVNPQTSCDFDRQTRKVELVTHLSEHRS